jgi:hypothetical protein
VPTIALMDELLWLVKALVAVAAIGGIALKAMTAGWITPKFLSGEKKRGARRGVPIHAYVGANGGGKTLAMIHDTLPSLAAGRRVLSNVPLLDPATGEPHPLWVPLRSWVQLLEAEHCDVLLDEAQGVVNSRESSAMPVQMLTMLMQLRKRDVCLRLTAPNFARIDKAVREVCQAVTVCRGYLPMAPQRIARDAARCTDCIHEPVIDDGELVAVPTPCAKHEARLWSMKQCFWWRTYDAMEWEQFSLQQVENIKPLATSWYWRPGRDAEKVYDTLGQVEVMDHLSDAGLCAHCGGKRMHRKCSCEAPASGGGSAATEPTTAPPAPRLPRPIRA